MTKKQEAIIERMWKQLDKRGNKSDFIGFNKDDDGNYYYFSPYMAIKTNEEFGNEAKSFEQVIKMMNVDTSSYKTASLDLDELKSWKKEHKKDKYEPYIINDEIGVNISYLIDTIEFTKHNTVFYDKSNGAIYIYGDTSSAFILPIRLRR